MRRAGRSRMRVRVQGIERRRRPRTRRTRTSSCSSGTSGKVEAELSQRLGGIAAVEEHLRTRRAEAQAADAALLATVVVSAQQLGALAGG